MDNHFSKFSTKSLTETWDLIQPPQNLTVGKLSLSLSLMMMRMRMMRMRMRMMRKAVRWCWW